MCAPKGHRFTQPRATPWGTVATHNFSCFFVLQSVQRTNNSRLFMTNGWPVGPTYNTEVGHTSQGVALG
jgi:hypothetical protein